MTEPKTFLSTDRIICTPEFIEKNKLSINTEGIAEKFEEKSKEMFAFETEVLSQYMTLEEIKPFLTEEGRIKFESGEEKWNPIPSLEETVQDFLDYMNFAWGKAEDERGISASRSIQKLSAWLWILNRRDLAQTIQREDLYNPYGAPALIEVCNQLGITVPESLIEFSKTKC